MIQQIKEIPITEASYPFASAKRYLDFDAYGYQEQEYYMQGTANIYQSINQTGDVEVAYQDVPYTNRIIVRSPTDIKKASGNVVVEIINPTSFMEIDRMWILGYQKFMRDGDIYVGITSKPNTIASMVLFDAKRYTCLSWPNPRMDTPFPFDEVEAQRKGLLPDIDIHYEPGLFWDMLRDLAWVLRGNDTINPICKYPRDYLYLTGWSQSACYLFRFVNSFAYREVARNAQVFDGYLAGGGVRNLIVPVNQYEALKDNSFRLTRIEHVEQPYISIQTESENGRFDAFATKRSDSDHPSFMYREYDVSGASHDTMFSYVNYYKNDEDLRRIQHLPVYIGKHASGNDYPSQILFAAAFKNLFRWVRDGVGPNHGERIAMNHRGENQRDVFGNAIGGLRTCLLTYPTGRFHITSHVDVGQSFIDPTSDRDPLFGYEEAFTPSFLKELYGSLHHYQALCEEDTAVQVSKGFICKEDGDALVEIAVKRASERGLT